MNTTKYWIDKLNLIPHPEGGYYKEIQKSPVKISEEGFCDNRNNCVTFREKKLLWTSIYFLLEYPQVSNFHRLTSDEIWYFHEGSPLTIYVINPEGKLTFYKLGKDIDNGESLQITVPANHIFGSAIDKDGFSLVSCMVSPGFEFDDFELFERNTLLSMYPKHKDIIERLTRP